jgi:hypothetical protein
MQIFLGIEKFPTFFLLQVIPADISRAPVLVAHTGANKNIGNTLSSRKLPV